MKTGYLFGGIGEEKKAVIFSVLLKKLKMVCEKKLANFYKNLPKRADKKEIEEVILKLFITHSRAKIGEKELERIKEAIKWNISQKKPIPVVLLWAYGGQALSPLKFLQPEVNLPKLGDIWALFWWHIFNEKVKAFWQPGIELYLVDEEPLLEILGILRTSIKIRHFLLKRIAGKLGFDFIFFKTLPYFDLEIEKEPAPEEVLSILASLPFEVVPKEKQEIIFSYLYEKRKKPFEEMKKMIGDEFWRKGVDLRKRMLKITEGRKKINWVEKEIVGHRFYIDACLTEKGRFAPKIWHNTFPQHGGTLIDTNWEERFSCFVLPEFKISSNFVPVYIRSSNFSFLLPQAADFINRIYPPYYIFYWT